MDEITDQDIIDAAASIDMKEVELDNSVFQIVRANQSKSKATILKIIRRENLASSYKQIAESFLRLTGK